MSRAAFADDAIEQPGERYSKILFSGWGVVATVRQIGEIPARYRESLLRARIFNNSTPSEKAIAKYTYPLLNS
jgi:hypothetical protein